jgi:hypothetical protein
MRIIAHLPNYSYNKAALADSDEYAMEAFKHQAHQAEQHMTMAGFNPEVARLSDVVDLLQVLIDAVSKSAGGKGIDVKKVQRPELAFARIRERQAKATHKELVKMMLGSRARDADD